METVRDLELFELVSVLEAEQFREHERKRSNPELDGTKARLQAQFSGEGQLCRKRLAELASSRDFAAALDIRKLDFGQLISTGVSSDLVAQLDRSWRELSIIYNGTVTMLDKIPGRIAALTSADIVPPPYREHLNTADQIARDIKNCTSNVEKEIEPKLKGLQGQLAKIMGTRRKRVETWRPDLSPVASERNPVQQITE